MKTLKNIFILLYLIGCLISSSCTNDECEPYSLSSNPGIELLEVPPINSFNNLKGRVKGVLPESHSIVAYIFVPSQGYWVKPYFNAPKTSIKCNSDFEIDITTGGIDETATRIKIFLFAKNFNPPLLAGESMPDSLEQIALAWIEVSR